MKIFTYQDYLKYQRMTILNKIEETNQDYCTQENEIYNKHDKMIKTILTKREVSRLLEKYLKINKPEKYLEEYNNKYITKNYKERESDIVYKEKGKNIFFLIEHQSTIDYKMPFRILEYSVEIIREVIKNQKNNKQIKYPKIIPIVIYTGNKKWNVKESINQMQEQIEGYEEEIFKYNLIDINNYTKEELLREDTMFSKVALLEKCKTSEEVIEVLKHIVEQTKENKEEIYRIINYIIRPKIGEIQTEKILDELKEEEEKSMVAEIFARECDRHFFEGKKEGKKEGKIEGKKEVKIEIIKEMKKQKYPNEIIAKITKLTVEEIKNI